MVAISRIFATNYRDIIGCVPVASVKYRPFPRKKGTKAFSVYHGGGQKDSAA